MVDFQYVRLEAGAPLAALDYPGTPAPGSGVLDGDRFWLDRPPGRLDGRHVVLAVGANAAPAVLAGKLRRADVMSPVPMVRAEVDGLAVGHSAHVSLGGYVPAGPYAADCRTAVVALWLTEGQVAALDATEPNYSRTPLRTADYPLHLDEPVPPSTFDIYVSRWGVLAADGVRLLLRTQRELHAELAEAPELAMLVPWHESEAAVAALADSALRDRVRQRLADAGWAVPADLSC